MEPRPYTQGVYFNHSWNFSVNLEFRGDLSNRALFLQCLSKVYTIERI